MNDDDIVELFLCHYWKDVNLGFSFNGFNTKIRNKRDRKPGKGIFRASFAGKLYEFLLECFRCRKRAQ